MIGTGPEEDALRTRASALGDRVRFHGFVPDHRDVERLLADTSLAAAPYLPDPASFTRHADPGKLKAYLAAGLPIVLTDVSPNARELAAEAGAELVPSEPDALAAAIARAHDDPAAWRARRDAALAYVRRFDWDVLFAGHPQAARSDRLSRRRSRALEVGDDRVRGRRVRERRAPPVARRVGEDPRSASSRFPERTTFSPRPSCRSVRRRWTRHGRSR